MNKQELVYAIRKEVYELEQQIKKLKQRCDNLTALADDLEEVKKKAAEQEPPSQFRKIVDSIYGEKPKRQR